MSQVQWRISPGRSMEFRCTSLPASLLSITHNEIKPSLLVFCWTRSQPSQAQVMSVTHCVMFTRRRNLVASRLSFYSRRLNEVVFFKAFQSQSSGRLLNTFFRPPTLVSRMQCQMASTSCFQGSGAEQQYHKRVRLDPT